MRGKEKSILASKLSFLLSISHYIVKYLIKNQTKPPKLPGVFTFTVFVSHSQQLSLHNTMLYTYCLQVSLLYLIPRMEKFC